MFEIPFQVNSVHLVQFNVVKDLFWSKNELNQYSTALDIWQIIFVRLCLGHQKSLSVTRLSYLFSIITITEVRANIHEGMTLTVANAVDEEHGIVTLEKLAYLCLHLQ